MRTAIKSTSHIIGADTYLLAYDADNRLTQIKKNTVVIADFIYNGDGQRVKSVLTTNLGATTTYFVGNYFMKCPAQAL